MKDWMFTHNWQFWVARILFVTWYTILCGGFAYLYWIVGIHDPRNIFGSVLSDIGALVVFPIGWIYLLMKH